MEQFGGLHAFLDALKSLLPGNPNVSEGDLVYLPYQIEALNGENLRPETFPHLIAVNLSPAELNVLSRHFEGQRVHDHPGKIKLQAGDVLLLEAGPTFIKKNVTDNSSILL